ncbi:MAG: bifunctional demethylmenaquinone methyltransferase/2-methoxy-6-polyprenyl-1,4-benzoquinol methylase UbiE [Pseudomonadota bacterium]
MTSTTYFGFKEVPVDDKQRLVGGVFDAVASRYDLMNDVLSGGMHRLWKAAMVDWLRPRPGLKMIDVAGGTGDIASRVLARVKAQAEITVCDINFSMLTQGRKRAPDAPIHWLAGDAQNLPCLDRSFDAYMIAFGIRNVTHIDIALREAYRVLKPGGRFLCLEFSAVEMPGLDILYDLYSFKLMPLLGEVIGANREAYQYLAESIRQFPDQRKFAGMIADAGFSQVSYRNLTGGIAAIHSGWRI